MATYKIALIYAPKNKGMWGDLYKRARDTGGVNAFLASQLRLVEITYFEGTNDEQLIQPLTELAPFIVLVDPALGHLFPDLIRALPNSTIISLNTNTLLRGRIIDPKASQYNTDDPAVLALGIIAIEVQAHLASLEAQDQQREELPSRPPEEKEVTRGGFDEDDEAPADTSSPYAPPAPAPQSKPGNAFLGSSKTEAGKGSGISPEEFLNPQFSAFYPQAVAPNQPYALMAFAHIESVADKVAEIAANYEQVMGGEQASGRAWSKVEVAKGTLLTLVPQIEGITFTPAEHLITWDGQPYYSATFLFTTPADLNADLSGRVAVFNGPLIIGEIPVRMALAGVGSSKLNSGTLMKKFEPIFASYSHRDSPVMEYFKRTREKLGQQMLVDVYDLRAGEHWAERLLDMIDESAVFQLFWSKHAAESKYCRQEWEHALQFVTERVRFIQPVWWAEPMPTPPPELNAFHFQRIRLPTTTHARMRLRRLLRRG